MQVVAVVRRCAAQCAVVSIDAIPSWAAVVRLVTAKRCAMGLGITVAVHGRLSTCCLFAAGSCRVVLARKPIQQSAGDSMG